MNKMPNSVCCVLSHVDLLTCMEMEKWGVNNKKVDWLHNKNTLSPFFFVFFMHDQIAL